MMEPAEKTLFRRFTDWLLNMKQESVFDTTGFKVKDNRWSIWYSNNYADDEGEIFPAAKIDEFISKVNAGHYPYPVLQYAHLSGTDHGKADGLWRVGNFVLATGTFDNRAEAAKWIDYNATLRQCGQKIGISHRYWYSQKSIQDGVYDSFQTFEISWFPVVGGVKPANPLTAMEVKTMAVKIPAELRENMKQLGGFTDAEIDQLETTAQQLDERAIAERRAAKIEGSEDTPVTPEDTQPAPVVEETKPEVETPVETPTPEPEPTVKPEDVEKAVSEAVQATEAKWQQEVKTLQETNEKSIQALTQAVTSLTKRLDEALTVHKPASKSIWTMADENDADVMDMKAAEGAAKKGKKRSVAEMMAGENHSDEM